MYAHLDSQDLAALAVREAEGRLDPIHYRGRVFASGRRPVRGHARCVKPNTIICG